jgi:hypothetical protein
MESVFRYYEFSDFMNDKSEIFSGNEICYSILNEHHFLIFEKNEGAYKLYVSKYKSKLEVGFKQPEILEVLVDDYDKSKPEHRIILRKYLY